MVSNQLRQLQWANLLIVLLLKELALLGGRALLTLANAVDTALKGDHIAHEVELLALERGGSFLKIGSELHFVSVQLVNA